MFVLEIVLSVVMVGMYVVPLCLALAVVARDMHFLRNLAQWFTLKAPICEGFEGAITVRWLARVFV